MEDLTFTVVLWRSEAEDAWRFVTVPADLTEDFRFAAGPPKGFGSVPVEVTVGATTWLTSLFPDTRRGSYLLPVKKAVRQTEGLDDGDEMRITLRILAQ